MPIIWTDEAIDDLVEILSYYLEQAGSVTAEAVQTRILSQIEALQEFPERVRQSERVQGAHELVIQRLPYIAFVQVDGDVLTVLNVVHTARKFPL
jgi:plasmid stabilization system protein ParE